jgi:hypothetical protein
MRLESCKIFGVKIGIEPRAFQVLDIENDAGVENSEDTCSPFDPFPDADGIGAAREQGTYWLLRGRLIDGEVLEGASFDET